MANRKIGDTFGPWPGAYDNDPPTGTTGGGPTTPPILLQGIPFWDDAPELWDTVVIAGHALSGEVKLTGEVSRKLDKKSSKGASGRTITDNGPQGGEFEINLVMWLREHWDTWQKILAGIDPNATKGRARAVEVAHPIFTLHQVPTVYIEKITPPRTGRVPQTREVTIKCTQWAPPPPKPKKSKTKTPKGAKSDAEYRKEDAEYARHLANEELERIEDEFPPGPERDRAEAEVYDRYRDVVDPGPGAREP